MSALAQVFDDFVDALRDDVRAIGGAKRVGSLLWPSKDPIAARNRLNDCLNARRRERLKYGMEQLIIRRAREIRGFSTALNYLNEVTQPPATQEDASQLQRELTDAVRHTQAVMAKLDVLTQSALRAVK